MIPPSHRSIFDPVYSDMNNKGVICVDGLRTQLKKHMNHACTGCHNEQSHGTGCWYLKVGGCNHPLFPNSSLLWTIEAVHMHMCRVQMIGFKWLASAIQPNLGVFDILIQVVPAALAPAAHCCLAPHLLSHSCSQNPSHHVNSIHYNSVSHHDLHNHWQ